MLLAQHQFDVFADFNQFVVCDSNADWSDLPDRWTSDALDNMFVVGPGYVAIGTARNMHVPVTVRLFDRRPDPAPDRWDKRNEAEIDLASGEALVTGVTDNGVSGGRVQIPAGQYRLRALYSGLHSLSEDGLSGDDRYVVELWPQ